MGDSLAVRRIMSASKRQWWVVVQAVVIVAAVAGYVAGKAEQGPYSTSASFLIKAVAADGSSQVGDLNRYYLGQTRILESAKMAEKVVAANPDLGFTIADVVAMVSVSVDPSDGSAAVTVEGEDPEAIVRLANSYGPILATSTNEDRNAALQTRLADLLKKTDESKAEYDDLSRQVDEARLAELSADSLISERQFALQQYQSLDTQAGAVADLIANQPQIVVTLSDAVTANRPPKPNVGVRVVLGAAVGFIVGLGLASLREALDDKLRDREAAMEVVGAPVIAEIPKSGKRLEGTMPVVSEPNRSLAEAIRSLRTTVRFLGVHEPIRSVAITSAAPGEGKSLIAANLAAAFALSGTRTILVSGDLRRPSVDAVLSATSEIGLSDLILALEQSNYELSQSDRPVGSARTVRAEDYLIDTAIGNLRFMPAGSPCPNPAEILGSPWLTGVIKELESVAEMVVIDCPPTVVADAIVLARVSDGAILVASLNRSRLRQIRSSVDRLTTSNATVLGVVVNRAGHERRSPYGSYPSTYSSTRAPLTTPAAGRTVDVTADR